MLVVLGRTRHVNGEHKCRSKSESHPHGDPHMTAPIDTTGCTSAYGRRNEFRRNPPLPRRDGEEIPLAGHALERVSAALLEFES